MRPCRKSFDSPWSSRQTPSRTSCASKKNRSLKSRMPSWIGSNPGASASVVIRPSNMPDRDEALRLRFLDDEDPEVAISGACERVSVSLAEDGDRGGRRRLAVRENFHGRSGRKRLEGLLRFDERVRAKEAARVDAPVCGALLRCLQFRSVHAPLQMNVTTPPSFAAGRARFRNPIMSSSFTPGSTVCGVMPWFFRMSFDAAQAQTSAPYLIASRMTWPRGGYPGSWILSAAPLRRRSSPAVVAYTLALFPNAAAPMASWKAGYALCGSLDTKTIWSSCAPMVSQ